METLLSPIDAKMFLADDKLFLKSRITIASYPGGKSDRKKHFPLYLSTPKKINQLIEPFAGLGNFFSVVSPRVSSVWLNDKDPEIYAILSCILDNNLLLKLIETVKSIEPVTRDDYYEWKAANPSEILQKAIRRLVILNCSPNGAGGGYSKEKANRKWYQNKAKSWLTLHHLFVEKKVRLSNWDYLEVLQSINGNVSFDNVFVYLDPPYYNVAKRGNLYGKNFNEIDLAKLLEILSSLSVHWILSNRDTPEIRKKFSAFHQIAYNTYNDMNNTRSNNPELLISNEPLSQ
ncbi:MAG: DNA adenine methylase [Candidatus Hodarchaeales archaeon]